MEVELDGAARGRARVREAHFCAAPDGVLAVRTTKRAPRLVPQHLELGLHRGVERDRGALVHGAVAQSPRHERIQQLVPARGFIRSRAHQGEFADGGGVARRVPRPPGVRRPVRLVLGVVPRVLGGDGHRGLQGAEDDRAQRERLEAARVRDAEGDGRAADVAGGQIVVAAARPVQAAAHGAGPAALLGVPERQIGIRPRAVDELAGHLVHRLDLRRRPVDPLHRHHRRRPRAQRPRADDAQPTGRGGVPGRVVLHPVGLDARRRVRRGEDAVEVYHGRRAGPRGVVAARRLHDELVARARAPLVEAGAGGAVAGRARAAGLAGGRARLLGLGGLGRVPLLGPVRRPRVGLAVAPPRRALARRHVADVAVALVALGQIRVAAVLVELVQRAVFARVRKHGLRVLDAEHLHFVVDDDYVAGRGCSLALLARGAALGFDVHGRGVSICA
mmetsp:Transcript_8024/g.23973  ORF Transcript_8024/g.23973 Transcript_8024/m.23973 type:complete len:447 (-) Transcript_8024:194-1534(-)